MGWSSTICVKESIRWCLGKSVHIENTWVRATQKRVRIVPYGNSSEDIGSWLSKVKNHWKEVYIRNSVYEISTPGMGELKQEQWSRIEREWVALKEQKRYLLPVERKRPAFERRPMQFPASEWRSCAKTRTHCRHTFRANLLTRSKCVEEEMYPRQKWPWFHSPTIVQIFFERYFHANVLWILASSRVSILKNRNGMQSRR